jgi:putative adenylate-forming enzyme
LPRSQFYRAFSGKLLAQLPIIDKTTMLNRFGDINTAGINLDEATAVALASEVSRDFTSILRGITVGLSSGTQGPRGVFLVSDQERARWAGIMMARVLPGDLMHRLLIGARPVKAAFFLRANSNLYTTVKSRRIDFQFYDLWHGVDIHLRKLAEQAPDILIAPARILGRLAECVERGLVKITPRRVIAVAEVLEPDDEALIQRVFGGPVHQLYQCTEGFLGYTCEQGVMHLNEEFVHVEPEWLDAEKTRFIPIVTDFSRTTQLVIRYRLNDILIVRKTPCTCGRVSVALEAVEGRCDDVLWLSQTVGGELVPVYPDMVRHAVASAARALPDYRIEQHGMKLNIAVADGQVQSYDALVVAIRELFIRQNFVPPLFNFTPFVETDSHVKRRRIVCIQRPEPYSTPSNSANQGNPPA